MPISNTSRSLTASDLKVVAELMAKDPEFAKELVEAISEKLDDKFGFRQGEMATGFEALSKKLDAVSLKIDTVAENIDSGFNTIDHNFEMLGQRQRLFEGELRKVNDRLDSIDDHLSINTDKRRPA